MSIATEISRLQSNRNTIGDAVSLTGDIETALAAI